MNAAAARERVAQLESARDAAMRRQIGAAYAMGLIFADPTLQTYDQIIDALFADQRVASAEHEKIVDELVIAWAAQRAAKSTRNRQAAS